MMAKERLRRLLGVMRQHSTSIEIVMMECRGSCKNRRRNAEDPADGPRVVTVGAEREGGGPL